MNKGSVDIINFHALYSNRPGTSLAQPIVATNSRSARSESVAISLYSLSGRDGSGVAYTLSGSMLAKPANTLLSANQNNNVVKNLQDLCNSNLNLNGQTK